LLLRWLMTEHGLRLGAISYKLAPLYAYWRPHVKGWLLLPIAVLAAYLCWLRRTRVATGLTDRRAVASFVLWFIAITTSVAMLDGGPRALIRPLVERPELEYSGAVDRVHGVREFMRDYPRLASTMPMHAQVHPPGAVLFVWAVTRLLGGGPWAAAADIIGFSALAVPLVYQWARCLGGPGAARRAAAIVVLTPSLVLFTATSMDGPFAVFLIVTMWLFWQSLESRPLVQGALAGVAAGLAALMTYSVTVAILFCGLAAAVTWLAEPSKRRAAISASAAALTGFAALHAVLWLATGYDPIEMFRVAVANSNHIMSGTRHESAARHLHLAAGNLVVFFVAAGLPCTLIWWPTVIGAIRSLLRETSHYAYEQPRDEHADSRLPPLRRFALTALATLLIAAVVPVYVLEVERVWMFLIPLVVMPVACRICAEESNAGTVRATMAVAVLVAAQTLLTEIVLTTYW
jgi:4-amino-4-deoxy-L-arabinose transferase-like glycosyltransferase